MTHERAGQSQPDDLIGEVAGLCEGFFADTRWLARCAPLDAIDLPPDIRCLLAHNNHMTGTLRRHYSQSVALRVLEHRDDGDVYRRKIILTVDSGQRVVEFGVVRMNLATLDASARSAVLSRKTPLGEIFEQFDVLTRVEPRGYFRFPSDSPVVQCFASGVVEAFGRLGLIHCNGDPAVQLLEVVPGKIGR